MVRSLNLVMAPTTLVVLVWWVSELAEVYQSTMYPCDARPDPQIEEMWRQRQAFSPAFESLCTQVAQGDLSLHEASRRVQSAAARHYPGYLKSVDTVHFDGNLDTKIAGSILFLLRREPTLEWVKVAPDRLAHLQREYEAMLVEARDPARGE